MLACASSLTPGVRSWLACDSHEAVRRTFATTGTALLVTSIVLACSFFIFTLGNFYGAVHLGLLVGCAAIIAFLADALVAPALLVEFGGPASIGS